MSAPAWKSAPDAPGFWVVTDSDQWHTHVVELCSSSTPFYAHPSWVDGSRYYGPIPEDENES